MAVGKSRGSKRSSSSSVASTITTVVFVALCIFGVWMLTSNSIAPPRATARTSSRATSFSNTNGDFSNDLAFSSSNEPEIKDHAAFEDNPGHLPDDAIKSDEPRKSQEDHNLEKEKVKDNEGLESADEEKKKQGRSEAQIFEESTMTQNQQAEQITQKSTDFVGTSNEEESNGNIEEQKIKEGTANLEESDQNQKSSENPIPFDVVHSESQSQKLNEFEKEQRQQRAEDAGDLKGAKEAQNAITDEDQKIQEQQEQQQDQQDQQKQPPITAGVTFSDATKEQQPTEHGFFKEITETEVPLNSLDHKAEQQQPQQQRQGDSRQSKNSLKSGTKLTNSNSGELFPDGGDSGIPKESAESKKSWKTQVTQSANEKERRKGQSNSEGSLNGRVWRHCNSTAGPDYIPCLDNLEALKKVDYKHFRHRERHCPEKPPTCLVPLPEGYKWPIQWPNSRDKIWYHNVPHGKLAEVKGHQNWVKVTGEFLTFPGGGTQFIHGALHYIDFLQESVRNIAWGKHTRVILDVGCGVASFGGYIFQRNVLTMSFAPKDEHEAQVQLALERGIPAISAVMGSQRLQFPSRVFDLIHCARCRVPWHAEGGRLLLELNRVLRPGGYFVWSATPVYQKLKEDVEIWEAMSSLTESMCWELVTITKDELDSVGAAFFRKPVSNECYHKRKQNQPPMCKSDDDPNAAWYVPLQSCMHTVPINPAERGSRWPEDWPKRLQTPPYWLNSSHMGIYGKPAPEDFTADYEHWKQVVNEVYMNGLGVSWSNVRNVMDMRAVYGGFAAAMKDLQVWVMNVVNIESPDTLPIIYERGLFGIYHDWCESFSTYPRSYDLLHADHLFSKLKQRCNIVSIVAEVDRIVRPGGKLIVRDESDAINEVQNLLKSLHWEVHLTPSGNKEILSAQKGNWRPETLETSS